MFREALELTMPVGELESRLKDSGVVAEDELWMYLCYRNCEAPFSMEEYMTLLEWLEEKFLSEQIYPEVYFEAAHQYVCRLWESQEYAQCRVACEKAIAWLRRGIKSNYLAELYFLDAMAGMRQEHNDTEEKEFYRQCKMAYYVGTSFNETETAEKIAKYCEEEFGWHITG